MHASDSCERDQLTADFQGARVDDGTQRQPDAIAVLHINSETEYVPWATSQLACANWHSPLFTWLYDSSLCFLGTSASFGCLADVLPNSSQTVMVQGHIARLNDKLGVLRAFEAPACQPASPEQGSRTLIDCSDASGLKDAKCHCAITRHDDAVSTVAWRRTTRIST